MRPAILTAGFAGLMIVGLTVPILWRDGADKAPTVIADVGSADFSYAANGVKGPTGRKPEAAKLWFNDGSWWGILFRRSRDAYVINRFDAVSGSWIDTGTIVDDRNFSRADVLWDGTHLYTVSGGQDPTSNKEAAIVARFSYDGGTRTYRLDTGFPFRITDGGSETFVFDRDDLGRLWVTYTLNQTVYVTHSLQTDRDWTQPFKVPTPEAENLSADDISAVVGYDGHVGVMWSDQTNGAMYFASHANGDPDGRWSVSAAIEGPALADDHMNLKALRNDPAGVVVATIKTSRNDVVDASPDDPLLVLVVLRHDGSWEQHTIGTVANQQTRPLLAIDQDHRMLYVFYSAPCCVGGTIYYKASPLDQIAFPPGNGTPFIRRGRASQLNNPASTKQNVGTATGLLVIAADDHSNYYFHNFLQLAGPKVPLPGPPASGSQAPGSSFPVGEVGPKTVWLTEAFEAGLGPAWKLTASDGSTAAVETGHARTDRGALHVVVSPTDKAATAVADVTLASLAADLDVSFDVKVDAEGLPDGNVPLLRLLDRKGNRLVTIYRQNSARGRIWLGFGDQHLPTEADLGLRTWGRVNVRLLSGPTGASIEVRVDGRLANAVLLPDVKGAVVSRLQWGNSSKGQPLDLYVDNVLVER